MKLTNLIIATTICLAQTTAFSQDNTTTSRDAKRKIVPGLKFGINRSNVYGSSGEAFASSRKQGYAAGIFVALPLGGFFGLQPELMLQQKGFEGSGIYLGDRYVISRTTTHIDIPVQLQVKFFKWFSFLVGPQYSFLVGRSDNFSMDNNTSQRGAFNSDDLRSGTFGTLIGFDLNIGHLVLSARSGWDVNKSHTSDPNYRNRWVQGTVGYRFY